MPEASGQEVESSEPSASRSSGSKQPSKGKNVRTAFVLAALLALLPLGLIFLLGDCGSAEGSMSVAGGESGGFTFIPTGCASMQPYGRMGANLHGDGPNDGAVYVTQDPTRGPAVEIEIPGSCRNADGTDCTVFEVPRDRCARFEVSVSPTGTVVNDVRLVEGRVALDCALDGGRTVRGRIDFDGC